MRIRKTLTLLVLVPAMVSCVSARVSDYETNESFERGDYQNAIERLKAGLEKEGDGDDELLYLMDLGLVLHTAGQYEESNRYFLRADKIAEIKDYTSLADESATLFTSDNIKQYQGEDFEKVMINTYLALNFLMLGKHESALVEVRKVNRKLERMITEGKRKYRLNAFARYLSGVIYEAEGQYGDAYIDYKQTLELEPGFPLLKYDLVRMAVATKTSEDVARWTRHFSMTAEDLYQARLGDPRSGKGEIVVIYQNGISPEKKPNPEFRTLPRFYPRYNPVTVASVVIDEEYRGQTRILDDIEATAIRDLDEKYAGLIAKKIAGMVAKEAAGEAVGRATDSPLLGAITKLVFYASDTADLRSWNFLPRDLQIARFVVEPGEHEVVVDPEGALPFSPQKVTVRPGKKTFVNVRFVPN